MSADFPQEALSGVSKERHLWNLVWKDLNPNDIGSDIFSGNEMYALSTDLESATDYGNISVGK
jgi:hypothetical protein